MKMQYVPYIWHNLQLFFYIVHDIYTKTITEFIVYLHIIIISHHITIFSNSMCYVLVFFWLLVIQTVSTTTAQCGANQVGSGTFAVSFATFYTATVN